MQDVSYTCACVLTTRAHTQTNSPAANMRVHEHDAAIAQPQLQLAVVVPKLAGRSQAPTRAAVASQLHTFRRLNPSDTTEKRRKGERCRQTGPRASSGNLALTHASRRAGRRGGRVATCSTLGMPSGRHDPCRGPRPSRHPATPTRCRAPRGCCARHLTGTHHLASRMLAPYDGCPAWSGFTAPAVA
jgi:hypothetical protein